jgi:hypothetical protein
MYDLCTMEYSIYIALRLNHEVERVRLFSCIPHACERCMYAMGTRTSINSEAGELGGERTFETLRRVAVCLLHTKLDPNRKRTS